MLLPIESAAKTLPNCCWAVFFGNAIALAMICFSLFDDVVSSATIFIILAFGSAVGFAMGLYLTYRSELNSTTALTALIYVILVIELLFVGGFVAFLPKILGRLDFRWMAFCIYTTAMLIFLAIGIYREYKALGLHEKSNASIWNVQLQKVINLSSRKIIPTKISSGTQSSGWVTYSSLIIGVGLNIPLLFELYTGNRFNAIFFAIPLLTAVWGYLNINLIGPSFLKILLLRKLEKSVGYRFINADLEQIQELRRTFFLSRWLMKDYVKS
jgi:hypothetical protein